MLRRTQIACRTTALVSVILLMMLALAASTTADTASYQAADLSSPGAPQTPLINYQGYLLEPATGEPVPDASYNATFELYAADAGGSPIWSEKQQIVTSKGLFSITLGTVNPIDPGLFDGYARWLSVSIDPDSELLPRIRVAHSPYAIFSTWSGSATSAHSASVADLAVDSERLGGNLPGAFAAAGHSHDATNIVSGNLQTDRYRAIEDLDIEGYLGNAAGDIALNNGVKQATLVADMLDGMHSTDFAAASHTHDKVARTHYASVPGEAFSPWVDVAYSNSGGCGGANIESTGCFAMVAPVQLPDGATINQFTIYFYDVSANDMSVTLYRQYYTSCGYISLASVSSSGTAGYYNVAASLSAEVDNRTGGYFVNAYSCNWASSSLLIKGAVIRYTISEAP